MEGYERYVMIKSNGKYKPRQDKIDPNNIECDSYQRGIDEFLSVPSDFYDHPLPVFSTEMQYKMPSILMSSTTPLIGRYINDILVFSDDQFENKHKR